MIDFCRKSIDALAAQKAKQGKYYKDKCYEHITKVCSESGAMLKECEQPQGYMCNSSILLSLFFVLS